MLLWMLWPSFVSSLLAPEYVTWATITCYMAGIGSIISTYVVCQILQKKINPLIFTYAMLAGPVAIGAPLLIADQWSALLIGIVADAVSSVCFIYMQPWLCKKLGILDVMGVHNLHGLGGWIGVIASSIMLGSLTNIVIAIAVVAIALAGGAAVGLVTRLTRGTMDDIMDDDPDFIPNEKPEEA
jgi:ammonium transporter Rh